MSGTWCPAPSYVSGEEWSTGDIGKVDVGKPQPHISYFRAFGTTDVALGRADFSHREKGWLEATREEMRAADKLQGMR